MAKKKSKSKSKVKSKAKAKTKSKAASAKKTKTKKAKAKKAKKPVRKSPVAKAKSAARPVKKSKAPAKKKKQIVGEGSYEATRAFDKDQSNFVKRNKDKIPALGKAAEAALEGPEGDSLREAEATAADRSRDTFDS